MTGDNFFYIYNKCDTVCMEHFLNGLSNEFPNDYIILCCDGAGWHKTEKLKIPENIELLFIPPYTPEMNPIEQIWEELREKGFRNEVFNTLNDVVERLCDTICNLTKDTIMSLTGREWILSI